MIFGCTKIEFYFSVRHLVLTEMRGKRKFLLDVSLSFNVLGFSVWMVYRFFELKKEGTRMMMKTQKSFLNFCFFFFLFLKQKCGPSVEFRLCLKAWSSKDIMMATLKSEFSHINHAPVVNLLIDWNVFLHFSDYLPLCSKSQYLHYQMFFEYFFYNFGM